MGRRAPYVARMPSVTPMRAALLLGTGFVAAVLATAVLLVAIELGPQGSSSATLLVGAGSMFLLGVLLMFPERIWLVGVGCCAGTVASVSAAILIAAVFIAQHTV
jgi:hypothetical protein